jgi:carbamoyl-phosphate synthase small subunit
MEKGAGGEMKRQLILEDGTVMIGEGFGSDTEQSGEVVFNTGMTGYQETLSDPSNSGLIVVQTYPLIGNCGINRDDFESIVPAINGFVVKEVCDFPSNWRNEISLDEFLKLKNIPGIAGVDTRKLTRIIRNHGTLKGAICRIEENPTKVIEKLKSEPLFVNQVKTVSTMTPYVSPGRGHRIVLVDFGMKHSILRNLIERNCDVVVVPYNYTAEQIMQLSPDGVLLSNGPGDPKNVMEAKEMISGLLGKVPIFGICLGHLLFALSCGADTAKMKFGHRGSNHPVKDLATGKVHITSQNHGYTVDAESIVKTRLKVTHLELNDRTIEGLRHKDYPAFSVQYHPEVTAFPEDSTGLFESFFEMIEENKQGRVLHNA